MPIQSPIVAVRIAVSRPYAFSRSASSLASVGGGSTGSQPEGETPQQRVARLKEAAKKAKVEKITLGDKFYYHGRIWADRTHRIVALGLIGATVLCGIATIATFTEIIIHNRRLKKQYTEETQRILALETQQRQEAEKMALIAAGEKSPEYERMTPEEIEKGKGVVANLRTWALQGLTPGDEEFRSRFDKEGGAEVIIDGPQDRWLPTKEGRDAEQAPEIPEPGKSEKRILEKIGATDEKQGKGMAAAILAWFGR